MRMSVFEYVLRMPTFRASRLAPASLLFVLFACGSAPAPGPALAPGAAPAAPSASGSANAHAAPLPDLDVDALLARESKKELSPFALVGLAGKVSFSVPAVATPK